MATRGVLGCVGVGVALVAITVLGWLALELVLGLWTTLAVDGPAGIFQEPILWHQGGQLLVVGALILALFAGVFRPESRADRVLRVPLWIGAALELGAWWSLPGGSRMSLWALVLAITGALAPLLLGRYRSG